MIYVAYKRVGFCSLIVHEHLYLNLFQDAQDIRADNLKHVGERQKMADDTGVVNPVFTLENCASIGLKVDQIHKEFASNNSNKNIQTIKVKAAEVLNRDKNVFDAIVDKLEHSESLNELHKDKDILKKHPRLTIPAIDIDEVSQDELSDEQPEDQGNTNITFNFPVPQIGVEEVEHENGDVPTPLPTPLPFQRGTSQNVFVFDPETVSMYSRRGSYSMDRVTPRLVLNSQRRGSYGQSGDMASLQVPTLRRKCLFFPAETYCVGLFGSGFVTIVRLRDLVFTKPQNFTVSKLNGFTDDILNVIEKMTCVFQKE